MSELTVILSEVQNKLNVPKEHKNDYGGYNFRNAEDIQEAVKPLLAPYNIPLIVTDELVMVGDRYYIKATAIIDSGDDKICATGYAREELERKKFDVSQLTGSASSYARKYALNGLLAIDDTKDSDHNNTGDNTEGNKTTPVKKAPPKEKEYRKEIKEIHTEYVSFFKSDTSDGITEANNEFKKIATELNIEKLLLAIGFDQAKVILRLRDKLKEIKGDK